MFLSRQFLATLGTTISVSSGGLVLSLLQDPVGTYPSPGIWIPASTPRFLPAMPGCSELSPIPGWRGSGPWTLEQDRSGFRGALCSSETFWNVPEVLSSSGCPLLLRLSPSVTQRLSLRWDGRVSSRCSAHLPPLPWKLVSTQDQRGEQPEDARPSCPVSVSCQFLAQWTPASFL